MNKKFTEINATELAALFKISRQAIYKLIDTGGLKQRTHFRLIKKGDKKYGYYFYKENCLAWRFPKKRGETQVPVEEDIK